MYKQSLYKIHTEHLSSKLVKNNNRYKKFEYGYNKDLDCVVISKDGTIGEIYEIQKLSNSFTKTTKKIFSRSEDKKEQYWEQFSLPKEFKNIRSIFDWKQYPDDFKENWFDYIDDEFNRRENGFGLTTKEFQLI